jgi:diguanylate cyclase (GGDEF)-like protein
MTSPSGRNVRKVLVVEDDPGHAALVTAMLDKALGPDADVRIADSLRAIEPRLVREWADCALIDLSLPDAEGLDSVLEVNALNRALPIIVLTNMKDDELAVEAVASGAQDFLAKDSLTPELLARSIRYSVERKSIEARFAHDALHDQLTGVANRSLLFDRLESAIARARRKRSRLAVFFLDLDGFKSVNDELGHDAGDQVLVAVARSLEGALRSSDHVARFGGDEFVVVSEDLADERSAGVIAQRLRDAVRAVTVPAGARVAVIDSTIGICIVDAGGSGAVMSAADAVRAADADMYAGKTRHSRAV